MNEPNPAAVLSMGNAVQPCLSSFDLIMRRCDVLIQHCSALADEGGNKSAEHPENITSRRARILHADWMGKAQKEACLASPFPHFPFMVHRRWNIIAVLSPRTDMRDMRAGFGSVMFNRAHGTSRVRLENYLWQPFLSVLDKTPEQRVGCDSGDMYQPVQ